MGESDLFPDLTEDQIDQIEDFELAMKLLKIQNIDVGNNAITLEDIKDILKLSINGENRKNSQVQFNCCP